MVIASKKYLLYIEELDLIGLPPASPLQQLLPILRAHFVRIPAEPGDNCARGDLFSLKRRQRRAAYNTLVRRATRAHLTRRQCYETQDLGVTDSSFYYRCEYFSLKNRL
ncbi:unnamed protein product [Spodoptera exigua]|nr:unnamed protein product [Spodoptera exigua]